MDIISNSDKWVKIGVDICGHGIIRTDKYKDRYSIVMNRYVLHLSDK